MNPVTVNYDDHRAWGNPNLQVQDNRPYAEIIFHGNQPTQFDRVYALIDTGADLIQVSDSIALSIGINLAYGTSKQIQTAGGGTVTVTEVKDVDVEFEGKRIKADCLFGQNLMPIFGRVAVLAAMVVGFDTTGWMFKKHPPPSGAIP